MPGLLVLVRDQIFGFDEQQEAHLREIITDRHCARFEQTLEIVVR